MITIRSVLARLVRPLAPARVTGPHGNVDLAGQPPAAQAGARELDRVLTRSAIVLFPLGLSAVFAHGDLFTLYQVQTQDLAVILALSAALVLLRNWAPAWRLPNRAPPRWALLATGTALAALLALGCHTLLWDFPLSRDEHMVVFDMAVFEKWLLATPMAPEWRAYAEALVPEFLFNDSSPKALVSGYFPGNALLRLVFAQIADPAWLNPLLALAGGVALIDVAKRLFGADPGALWVTLLVYALSAQMLANTMTPYAMTGHMTFNLVWLAAFLRGGRVGHAVAIAIAFVAVGYHQVVFHPLFAAPFVLWRLRQGAWRLALVYGVAYALIVGWWMAFPLLTAIQTGVPAAGHNQNHSFIQRILPLLVKRDPLTLQLMLLNLLRFISWQHLALLPLLFAALPSAWRERGPSAPMLWGIGLTLVFIGFVLPFQGHGWGYRYLHPHLGSFALLAGVGYRRLAAAGPPRVDGVFAALTVLTLLGQIPLHLWQQREFYRPHVELDRFVTSRDADFVVIDSGPRRASDGRWGFNPVDEVRNRPDLANRPLVFSSRALTGPLAAELCRRGSVSLVGWDEMHAVGFGRHVSAQGKQFEQLRRVFEQGGCVASKASGDS